MMIKIYVAERIAEFFIDKFNRRSASKISAPKNYLFYLMMVINVFLPISIYFEGVKNINTFFAVVFVILIIIKLYLIYLLKDAWTIWPSVDKNQKIVKESLYKIIRHPNYLIVILEFLIFPLIFNAIYTAFAFFILNLFFILSKIKMEEEFLLLNEVQYEHYQKKTKKLIPFLFSFF